MPARSTSAAQDGGGEVVRPDAGERAAVAADRRPDGLDDPGFAEGTVRGLGVMRLMVARLTRQGGSPLGHLTQRVR